MRPTIIAVTNQKGGVGKTTTAVTIAAGLAAQGLETLLIDFDPQGQVAMSLGLEKENGVYELLANDRSLADVTRAAGRPHLAVIPGDKRTATAQGVLQMEHRLHLSMMKDMLKPALRNGLRVVVFDTAPSLGGLQEMAIVASDLVIIPTKTDYLSSGGAVEIMKTIHALKDRHGWHGHVMGVLPTFYKEGTNESQRTLEDLRETFSVHLVLDVIHDATVLAECAGEGATIWEKAPRSRAAEEYARLVWKVRNGRT